MSSDSFPLIKISTIETPDGENAIEYLMSFARGQKFKVFVEIEPEYKGITKRIKAEKGQPYDRVTLKDSFNKVEIISGHVTVIH